MDIEFPPKLQPLFEPKRYKILYGGRGGSKSWGIARALLVLGASKPLRIFCGREIQKSIKDSVHKLLSDQIRKLSLQSFYTVLQSEIRGRNGTEFMFAGLKHNIDNIKSLEAVDIAWIEEAQTVSKDSWETLIPTIRKDNSEIWVSFNPELEEDDTYQRFVIHPPTNSTVIDISWADNPWFPEILKQEMEDLKLRNYDAYLNVWEGKCKQMLEGAIYAEEMRQAMLEKRITKIPLVPNKPVNTYWDLGHADFTAIWFVQSIGHEFRLIDYYQNQFKKIPHYLQVLQEKPYIYKSHILPHDARYETLNAERTTERQIKDAYPNASVTVLPNLGIKDGIDAARSIFNQCWFDEDKCSDGLQALRRYAYERDTNGKWGRNPAHNEYSHGADAFRYMAISIKGEPKEKPSFPRATFVSTNNWMNM